MNLTSALDTPVSGRFQSCGTEIALLSAVYAEVDSLLSGFATGKGFNAVTQRASALSNAGRVGPRCEADLSPQTGIGPSAAWPRAAVI